MISTVLASSLALASAAAILPEPEENPAPAANVPSENVRLSGAPVAFLRNNGRGNWESFSFVIRNDEAEAVAMTLCPDAISRYSIEAPEQAREFSFALSTGKGRWSKSCQTVALAPGEQMVRHAYFKFGEQDGAERLFVLDTNLGQLTFVDRREQANSPVLANFQ